MITTLSARELDTALAIQQAITVLAPHQHDYRLLPLYDALCHYRDEGGYVGDFLFALLSGNYKEAMMRADHGNLWLMPIYAAFLYNEMPSGIHGTPECVTSWIDVNREVAS